MIASPYLTVIIPTLNESRNLPRILTSLVEQDFPKERLEVLVADGGSTDGSVKIARSFANSLPLRTIDNSDRREAEYGKALALLAANGELVQFMDADMWPSSPSLLRRLAEPLARDSTLAGSVAPYVYSRDLNLWNRFLSCDEFQRDPLLQSLTPEMDDFLIERRSTYDVCSFNSTRIPPMGGTTMFRVSGMDLDRWGGHFREVDHPAFLIKSGSNRFAYVRDVGWLHEHCRGLSDLVRKRIRNVMELDTSFVRMGRNREFTWVDLSNRREVFRVLRWIIGTNLLVPRVIEGVLESVRLRRREPLLRPIAALAITDSLIVSLLRTDEGRKLIRSSFR